MQLDTWQKEVLGTSGNICLRSGRQVGKSTIIGLKAAKYALENSGKLIMVISKTERQAGLLFSKILNNLSTLSRASILTGRKRPTKHLINLKNGSTIYCLPAGDTGFGIMGFTIHLLIADEAAFIPEEVWNSIIPAMAITRGAIWLLSTPFIKQGYYYECFNDPTFTAFHTSSEDCPRADHTFLAHKKANLTKSQYAQMYLGQFVDELLQFFPEELIKQTCILKRPKEINLLHRHWLGCDVARMDRDEFTYEIFEEAKILTHVESIVTKNVPIPESTRRIIELDKKYNFKKEYIDSGGMGITVCDLLRENNANRRKVVEINNASRMYAKNKKGLDLNKQILKVELYNHLKKLMQRREVQLLDDIEIRNSLKSVLAEHDPLTGKLKIWGENTHITEGLIRGAWGVHKKHLNIYSY